MKKFLLLIAMTSMLFLFTACGQPKEPTEEELAEQQIIELALWDIRDEVDADNIERLALRYIISERVEWRDCDEVCYILTVDDRVFTVSVLQDGYKILGVDVLDEL